VLVSASPLALVDPATIGEIELAVGVMDEPARGVVAANGDVMAAAIGGRDWAVVEDPKGKAKAPIQFSLGPFHAAGGGEPAGRLELPKGSDVSCLLGGVAMALDDLEVIEVVLDASNPQVGEVHGNRGGLAVAPASGAIVGLVKEGQGQGDGPSSGLKGEWFGLYRRRRLAELPCPGGLPIKDLLASLKGCDGFMQVLDRCNLMGLCPVVLPAINKALNAHGLGHGDRRRRGQLSPVYKGIRPGVMRRFGIVAACWQGAVRWPGRRRRSSPERRPMGLQTAMPGPGSAPDRIKGAITSQKVMAQGDQLTSLSKQLWANGAVNSSPDDIGC